MLSLSTLLTHKFSKYVLMMGVRGTTILVKFALSVYLARVVGLDVLGAFGLIVALTLALPMLVRSGLFNTFMRDFVDADPTLMVKDLVHYFTWIGGIYMVLLPIGFVIDGYMPPEIKGLPLLIWLIIVLEHLAVDVVMMLNTMRKPQSANVFGLGQAIAWALPFIVVSYFVPDLRDVHGLLYFWIGGTILSLVAVWPLFAWMPWKNKRKLDRAWYVARLKDSRFLFANDVLSILSQFSDRYLIAMLMSLEMAGVYAFFMQIATALFTLINSSIMREHRPEIISLYRKHKFDVASRQMTKLAVEALGVLALLCLVAGVGIHFVVPYLHKPLVAENMGMLWLVLLGILARVASSVASIPLFSLKKDLLTLYLSLAGVVVFFAFSFAGKGALGAFAMPWAVIISCLLTTALGYVYSQKMVRNSPHSS
jgi:O-antigen/teichoic acid export membrane protein